MKAAQAELEKAFAETETEKAFRLSLESKLSEMKKMQEQDLEWTLALEDKDRSGSAPWEAQVSSGEGENLAFLSLPSVFVLL